jgi:uncharacterized protein (UPF0332 family)
VKDVQALLDKAARAFDAAAVLLRNGDADFAVSRAYYAYFYTAQALLSAKGQEFSSHAQVVGQYGFFFARTGALDPTFHQLLLRAFKIRQLADYQTEVEIESEVVEELIAGGRQFLTAAREYLEQLSEGGDPGAP